MIQNSPILLFNDKANSTQIQESSMIQNYPMIQKPSKIQKSTINHLNVLNVIYGGL